MNVRCVFELVLITRKSLIELFLITLSMKNGGHAFSVRLDLMLSMSILLWWPRNGKNFWKQKFKQKITKLSKGQ